MESFPAHLPADLLRLGLDVEASVRPLAELGVLVVDVLWHGRPLALWEPLGRDWEAAADEAAAHPDCAAERLARAFLGRPTLGPLPCPLPSPGRLGPP